MTRVGWLQDDHGYVGGAEMTAAEFRAAAPDGVEVIDCPPGDVNHGCDVYVAHNAVQYSPQDFEGLPRVVKYAHDVFPHDLNGSRGWLVENAEWIFCSPAQRERMSIEGVCIPPALDLDRCRPSRQVTRNTERKGIVSVAQWRNPGKGPTYIDSYAEDNGPVDVYGPGEFYPRGSAVNYLGEIEKAKLPELLWNYETFVFLPVEFEPFGRTVVEAHYAGCGVICNGLIGARYYLEENPQALENAAERFWEVVCG
jgi:hypothetical protein